MSKRALRGVVALVPLALALTACGSSAAGSPGAASAPSPTAVVAQASAAVPTGAGVTPFASASPSDLANAALDACAIFPIDLATQLAGVAIAKTVKGGGPSGSTCTYSAGSTYVAVSIKELPDAAAAVTAFTQLVDGLTSAGGTGSVTPLQGVGDKAVELRTSASSITLAGVAAVKGSILFSIETSAPAADSSLQHCAQTVADQLPV